MGAIRDEVLKLAALGKLPDAAGDPEQIGVLERALAAIEPPVTAAEAELLIGLFGTDDCFGLAWSLVHLIESCVEDPLPPASESEGEWVRRLRQRAAR